MVVKKGAALKPKSYFAFIWYLLAWFTFRTLPIMYCKVASNAEAVEQNKETVEHKKWGSKVRAAALFSSSLRMYGGFHR
jgi:hypothetical protein